MVAQVIKNQIEKIEYREKNIFWSLFSVFVFFLVSYGVLVNNTIMNAVAKQNMEKEMATLNSEVNSMEFNYLNMKNNITMERALSLGFVAVSEEKFASVSGNTNLSLSVNEN